jgi:hypothetical protein
MSGGDRQQFIADTVTESEHVGKVLELLCGIGAAYKYLWQVSRKDIVPSDSSTKSLHHV